MYGVENLSDRQGRWRYTQGKQVKKIVLNHHNHNNFMESTKLQKLVWMLELALELAKQGLEVPEDSIAEHIRARETESFEKFGLRKEKLTKTDGETINWDALGILIFDLIEKVESLEKHLPNPMRLG